MEDIIKAKTYICDVIDYDRDIKPFPLIKIYSGVGSGKSHFAAQMITGSEKCTDHYFKTCKSGRDAERNGGCGHRKNNERW